MVAKVDYDVNLIAYKLSSLQSCDRLAIYKLTIVYAYILTRPGSTLTLDMAGWPASSGFGLYGGGSHHFKASSVSSHSVRVG